jgi:hypothetical protein
MAAGPPQSDVCVGEYCFHETWRESLELLTHVRRVKTSLDETTPTIIPLRNPAPQYGLRRSGDSMTSRFSNKSATID